MGACRFGKVISLTEDASEFVGSAKMAVQDLRAKCAMWHVQDYITVLETCLNAVS